VFREIRVVHSFHKLLKEVKRKSYRRRKGVLREKELGEQEEGRDSRSKSEAKGRFGCWNKMCLTLPFEF